MICGSNFTDNYNGAPINRTWGPSLFIYATAFPSHNSVNMAKSFKVLSTMGKRHLNWSEVLVCLKMGWGKQEWWANLH